MMGNRVVVAISGGGRSLANLLAQKDRYQYEIVGVISSSATCKGNDIALGAKLPLVVADFGLETTAAQVEIFLTEHCADWVVLAGFLKKFPIAPKWASKTINIHPALLPRFGGKGMYGLRVHEAVMAAEEPESGATIHFVNERYDDGAIIAQAKVKTAGVASAPELAARVFEAECKLFPQALHDLITGRLPQHEGVKIYEF